MLSLVVPFYNEGRQIIDTYKELKRFLRKNYPHYELIFVNDGSTDKTWEILKGAIENDRKATLLSYKKNQGRGYAIKRGWSIARGNFLGYIDGDLEIKPKYIRYCINRLTRYDGAVASKYTISSKVETTPLRKIASKVFNLWIRIALGSKLADHQTGLKIFRRAAILNILSEVKSNGWLFDVELLYYMQSLNFKIVEVPIEVRYGFGKIKKSFVKDFFASLLAVWNIRNDKLAKLRRNNL